MATRCGYILGSCRELFVRVVGWSEPLIVHHWDADGVASAAIILVLNGVRGRHVTPPIEVYGLDWLGDWSSPLVFLDYALSASTYARLLGRVNGLLAVFDHHSTGGVSGVGGWYCNPVAAGCGGEREWPSTSYLLYILASGIDAGVEARRVAGLAGVGVAGDVGYTVWARSILEDLASRAGLSIDDFTRAANLIDSCYRLDDVECIGRAVRVLVEDGVEGLLGDRFFEERAERVREVLGKYAGMEPAETASVVYGGGVRRILLYHVETVYNIASALSKELASKQPGDIIVLVYDKPGVKTKVYVRSATLSIGGVVCRCARERGYYCVNKTNIAVLEFPYRGSPRGLGWLVDCLGGRGYGLARHSHKA